ncbi:FAD:protein FMN transferase [Diaminobutyricimonas sp. TR449]|uniref:FAD:protein FMN transferase n=1 Tax=Diaminobutyricimonas sp. TR449 TaxID=2708076 RepID=UPI00142386C1|nr:FAD:protein FMN transferase [Diaminobutyricimonas sp. TR449]
MPPHSLRFEAIGTGWQIDTAAPLSDEIVAAIHQRIDDYDRAWSRFRDDSLVSRMAREPGQWRLPSEAAPLLELYRRLYTATDGAVSPLVGDSLVALGYDRSYSLRSTGPTPAARWEDAIAWDGEQLTCLKPVTIDVGAAGKGQLVDLVGALLAETDAGGFTVDASGDLLHSGPTSLRVALEHPLDASLAVGVVELGTRALCASAANRRTWGDRLHHILDATTGLPTRRVLATWVIADSALIADGLATALFFAEPERLHGFEFEYVRMFDDGRLDWSPGLQGEVFA